MPELNDTNILAANDTIGSTDSLSMFASPQFQGVGVPSDAIGQHWIFATMLILLVLFVLAVNRSHSWMVDALKNITKVRERGSLFVKTSIHEYQSRWLLIFFAIGFFALFYF